MSCLHTLNKATAQQALLERCLESMSEQDALVLIEDGVYWAALAHSPLQTLGKPVYALATDLSARGLELDLQSNIQAISDSRFVELCCQHSKTLGWF